MHSTVDMDQMTSTDGCLNCEGAPTDGCSQLYIADIEIILENVVAIKISHNNEYEYLLKYNEELISTPPSPLELQEVDQIKQKEEEKVRSHEPSFIEGSLKMSQSNIHEPFSYSMTLKN